LISTSWKPLSGDASNGGFCQNDLAGGFPLGAHSGPMVGDITLVGTQYASFS
jgi:hypothetical protein